MKRATYCRLGQWNGAGPLLYMIRFWRKDGAFGSCYTVEEGNLAREIAELRDSGWHISAEG